VARSLFPEKSASQGTPGFASGVPKVPPKLKEIRKEAVSESERRYLKDLISFAGGDNAKACRISGLSRSRFYTLLRKYRPDVLR
jgi:DNA-binding NtrC family response regulator